MKLVRIFAIVMLTSGSAAAQAGSLSDPMRPHQYTATEAAAVKAGPVLQSVIISKERRHAIISGERIAVGGAYGDAKLVRIIENEVTLRDAAGDTVLKLVPEIKKQIVTPKVASHDTLSGR